MDDSVGGAEVGDDELGAAAFVGAGAALAGALAVAALPVLGRGDERREALGRGRGRGNEMKNGVSAPLSAHDRKDIMITCKRKLTKLEQSESDLNSPGRSSSAART